MSFAGSDMAALRDLALERSAIDSSRRTIDMCQLCFGQLQKRRMPSLALANGLQFGRVPHQLQILTWVEQRLLAVYNVHIYMLHFRSSQMPASQVPSFIDEPQPHFRGSVFTVPQDCVKTFHFLPPSPEQLSEIFQVLRVALCTLTAL